MKLWLASHFNIGLMQWERIFHDAYSANGDVQDAFGITTGKSIGVLHWQL